MLIECDANINRWENEGGAAGAPARNTAVINGREATAKLTSLDIRGGAIAAPRLIFEVLEPFARLTIVTN